MISITILIISWLVMEVIGVEDSLFAALLFTVAINIILVMLGLLLNLYGCI